MPTYDYRCKDCRHEFELFQSMTAKPERTCPACGKKALERLIGTGAALLFKGSGFYQTDYRSESYKKSADADKPASPSAEAKSGDGKSPESKPADTKEKSTSPAEKPAAAKSSSAKINAPMPGGPGRSKSGGTPAKRSGKSSRKG